MPLIKSLHACALLCRTGGPWIDVCLKAYYVEGVADPWQARQYQICDTHMRQHIVAQGAG